MKILASPSPNCNSRDVHVVDMLVLHYTDMVSAADAIGRLCDPKAEVSAHYLVDEEGAIYRLVDEKLRAWHAGKSYWRGNSNINQRSIGIEIANPGHRFGYRNFPKEQMHSVMELCADILSRHNIPARNIVGHSDIAPMRKKDPGELFNWKMLAENGIGLWPDKDSAKQIKTENQENQENKTAHAIDDAIKKLSTFGYDISDPASTITAFQRHYRQNLLNGKWDDECEQIINNLLYKL